MFSWVTVEKNYPVEEENVCQFVGTLTDCLRKSTWAEEKFVWALDCRGFSPGSPEPICLETLGVGKSCQ